MSNAEAEGRRAINLKPILLTSIRFAFMWTDSDIEAFLTAPHKLLLFLPGFLSIFLPLRFRRVSWDGVVVRRGYIHESTNGVAFKHHFYDPHNIRDVYFCWIFSRFCDFSSPKYIMFRQPCLPSLKPRPVGPLAGSFGFPLSVRPPSFTIPHGGC